MVKQKTTEKNSMSKIAIVTYNRIGEGQYDNGLMQRSDKQIYLAQNGHKSKWTYSADDPSDQKAARRESMAGYVVGSVDLKDMDQIFLYVGSHGGEEAIRKTADIPAEKITYVMCNCNWSQKKAMISQHGNNAAKIQDCECGGQRTLEVILKGLLK